MTTTEFQDTGFAVTRLYFAYFLRRPDYDGLHFWMAQQQAGMSLEAVSQAFAQSAEFQALYGSLSNRDFVIQVYLNVLERQPDQQGLDFWTGQLDSGALTRGQVMLNFSESTEFKNRIFNKVYVALVYACMVRRAPTDSEFNGWVGQLNAGTARTDLVSLLLGSTEYRGRFIPL